MSTLWDVADIYTMKAMLAAGTPIDDIAKAFGRSRGAIERKARDHGWKAGRKLAKPWTQEETEALIAMRDGGATFKEIARALRRGQDSVSKHYLEATRKLDLVEDRRSSNKRDSDVYLAACLRAFGCGTVGELKAYYRERCEIDIPPGTPNAEFRAYHAGLFSTVGSQAAMCAGEVR